ncbi:MAG: hypothetical protein QOG41_2274 [Thermoleophilaceae bacterium]|jgi:hypothetical protein|nr:hypothetical protein [Thermoleophilaceae bacterium]MEA2349967.1 hypothetical protein [Thermoleophilaceae bacterium]MEA2352438.1 hypothetical protein [Thermoleophilaceae bacterium]MEA2367438.1 hypothetical protein [Thermoleophilaceae bacterium]MEA2389501.1 hypothetical protein [Thermoleophilaceae bacterium]
MSLLASTIGGAAVIAGGIILVFIGVIAAYVVVSRVQRTRRGGL